KVLVIGDSNRADLYDPLTGNWTMTDNMNHVRSGHTASVLTNGTVLVTGGSESDITLNSSELYQLS
ncbi:unnamed protein product, partial [Rotaria sp. Silwood1]